MAVTTSQYEKISRFIDGDMDIAEMEQFEGELQANPELRQQLDFELSVRDTLKSGTTLNTNKTKTGVQHSFPPTRNLRVRTWLVVGIAASIALIVFISIMLQRQPNNSPVAAGGALKDTGANKPVQPKDSTVIPSGTASAPSNDLALFNQYYQKDEIPEVYPLFLADAFSGYEAGNYKALLQLNLAQVPETRGNPDADKGQIAMLAHYYKGLAFLETGQAGQAIKQFSWVIENQADARLQVKALWFLALAYLRQHDRYKARQVLQDIQNSAPHTRYQQSAKALLSTLRNEP